MYYYELISARMIGKRNLYLTYSSEDKLAAGELVQIDIAGKISFGIIIKEVPKPAFSTKPVGETIGYDPLPPHLLETMIWISKYYATPLTQVIKSTLPSGLLKNRRAKPYLQKPVTRHTTHHKQLTATQVKALQQLSRATPGTTQLLHGVPGSGKTRIYIELAKKVLEQKRSVIILVPEIGLTTQLESEFVSAFSPEQILLTHSKLTESQRHQIWSKALAAKEPLIVIGPRSALFTPLASLGLIVADEAHDDSYKQDQSPKYDALRVAAFMAKTANASFVMGTATPAIDDLYQLISKNRSISTIDTPITDQVRDAAVLVDLRNRGLFTKSRWLSDTAIEAIGKSLARDNQAMVFINRRGTATTILCSDCGWNAHCPNCLLPLTFHQVSMSLRCHICDYKSQAPLACPECKNTEIVFRGAGTQRIESELQKIFPNKTVLRIDQDSYRTEATHDTYAAMYEGKADIIIGTQMITKGLDLPHLETVVVVAADTMLNLPDYSSGEKTFQLLYQVIGRSGRHLLSGKTVVQTYNPTHPIIEAAITHDYKRFFDYEIKQRDQLGFPPFRQLLKISCQRKTSSAASSACRRLLNELDERELLNAIEVLGPAPAFHEKTAEGYNWQIIFKSRHRQKLLDIVDNLPGQWMFTLDPRNLL